MTLEQLAYETALRNLDKQEAVLEEIRARTGALLASSAVVTGLLGDAAFGISHSWVAMVALTAFTTTVLTSAYILVPKEDRFAFAMYSTVLYEQSFALRGDLNEVYRRLIYELDRAWVNNDDALEPMFKAFRFGTIALVVEVGALALMITGTIG